MKARVRRTTGLEIVALALGLVGCGPEGARDDTGPAQANRERAIERLLAGDPAVADADAGYTVLSREPLVVFFETWHGFGSNAYCGYEYAANWTAVMTSPLGGQPRDVEEAKAGWFWLCAG